MKKQIFIIALIVALFACNSQEKKKERAMPLVDVSKTYSEKVVKLQDVANIEYIPLETKDDVLLEEYARIAHISKDTVIVFNPQQGDIFIFNGQGKFLSKFNNKGQSGTEYIYIHKLIFAPKKKEILVADIWNKKKVFAYDVEGNYNRSFDIDKKHTWGSVKNYNDSLLLCYDIAEKFYFNKKDEPEDNLEPFMFISKLDGKLVSCLDVKLEKRISTKVIVKKSEQSIMIRSDDINNIIKFKNDEFIINDISIDTIYRYTANKQLVPFIAKQPSIRTMAKNKEIWLDIEAVTDKYIFMQSAYKTGQKEKVYESTNLLLDRETNEIFQCKIENADYNDNLGVSFKNKLLPIGELTDALDEGKLSGKLKTIVEKIGLDDNPVLMKISMK